MESQLTTSRTVNITSAAILSILLPGLGHASCGRIWRGIILHILSSALILAGVFVCLQPFPLFNILLAVGIVVFSYLFVIVDCVLIAKDPRNSLKLKPLPGYFLLVGILLAYTYVLQPLIKDAVRHHFVQAFQIPSVSMTPALLKGDYLLVNKRAYNADSPRKGDIVVLESREEPGITLIRRVVAVGGDMVEIRDGQVHLDSRLYGSTIVPTESQRPNKKKTPSYGPATLPQGSFLVLADNWRNSQTRSPWDVPDAKRIKGKAATIYFSWDSDSRRIRWERIGKPIN
jgi:signal peptidase I